MDEKYANLLKWLLIKIKIHKKHLTNDLRNVFIPRNAIYTCNLGENIGYEKGGNKSRPVLVVSHADLNKKSGNVVIVPLSSKIKWKDKQKKKLRFDSHYVLYKSKYNKLDEDSAVQCEDIRVVSKNRLGDFVCYINDTKDVNNINKRLKYTLQL